MEALDYTHEDYQKAAGWKVFTIADSMRCSRFGVAKIAFLCWRSNEGCLIAWFDQQATNLWMEVSMRKALFLAIALLTMNVSAQDAVKTDGDKYKVKLENDCVRVLEYHDLPGEKTHQHRHPAFVCA